MDKKIDTKTAASSPVADDPSQSLEAALSKLDAILERMEAGDLPLETLLEEYEAGVLLVKFCQERLDAVEKRIQIVTKSLDGSLHVEPFEVEEA